MGRQYNKVLKAGRRKAYQKRKKAVVKAAKAAKAAPTKAAAPA